jgi:arsenate reductase
MKRILFVCIGNSCRSQIAEGFARYFGGEELEIKSVGIAPATSVSRKAKQVMLEKGIDISDQYPKQLMPEDIQWADKIIIMGCDVKDPGLDLSSDKIENWSIDDPIGKTIEEYLEIRDEIEAKIKDLFIRF